MHRPCTDAFLLHTDWTLSRSVSSEMHSDNMDQHLVRSLNPNQVSYGFVFVRLEMYWRDEWPSPADGHAYDGRGLLQLLRRGECPFKNLWDVNLLIEEIEEKLGIKLIDIPMVDKGSNNYVSSITL